jgi:ankyrin repeat protein
VDDRQHGGYTALHAAAMHGQDDVVDLLLARGADPSVRTGDGKSAADFAEEGGHAGLAQRLRARAAGA